MNFFEGNPEVDRLLRDRIIKDFTEKGGFTQAQAQLAAGPMIDEARRTALTMSNTNAKRDAVPYPPASHMHPDARNRLPNQGRGPQGVPAPVGRGNYRPMPPGAFAPVPPGRGPRQDLDPIGPPMNPNQDMPAWPPNPRETRNEPGWRGPRLPYEPRQIPPGMAPAPTYEDDYQDAPRYEAAPKTPLAPQNKMLNRIGMGKRDQFKAKFAGPGLSSGDFTNGLSKPYHPHPRQPLMEGGLLENLFDLFS